VVLQQMVTAREKQLKLSVDLDHDLKPVMGEQQQLQRALWNLVSNAIKFTPLGGSITVSTRMVKKSISIQVADTGAGMPKAELSTLFSEFKRLKGTAHIEGTGLGLFIVKTIVESHQGTVSVESIEGTGTTFTIILPAAKDSWNGIQAETAAHEVPMKNSEPPHRTARGGKEPTAETFI
ncbi:MAG TPA: ATP-binding protein, partial [Candidatus Binatus sp.]|nr:ATP-binding protein [Candidatus Binatus sp.]